MAAYAALTSLVNIIHQIQHHPFPPISLDKQQVISLTKNVTFFQEIIEGYKSSAAYNDEADPMEMRIAEASYAAEDVIESHIVDMIELQGSTTSDHQIIDSGEGASTSAASKNRRNPVMLFSYFGFLMKPTNPRGTYNSVLCLHQGMRKVIRDMDLIRRDLMKIKKEKNGVEADQLQRIISVSGGSSLRSSIMVGFDDVLHEVLDKLTGGQPRRQVIPIVGMGGIGKTTLTRYAYSLPFVKDHFDVFAWATISQKYNSKEILSELLSQANKKSKEELSYMSEDLIGLELYKHLSYRRFMIVLDDTWSIEAWEKVQRFFPDNNNGSRIVVTTRLSTLGSRLDSSYCLKMKFLDEGSSWDLFSKSVFGEESCPPELEETGKQIVENCRGLPLSIVVVGGLLKRVERAKGCWESIRKNTSAVVNSEKEDFCMKILKISYTHLPVYLKPCFLYMGVFEEDRIVRVSTLVKLWASEGFLKQASDKCLETTAKEYLNDLVERNLIIVHELGCTGNIKFCRLHGLLRDLCCREAEKEGFYTVIGKQRFQGLNKQRCVVIRERSPKEEVHDVLRSMPLARSLVCDSKEVVVPLPAESRLLRTLKAYDRDTSGSHDYMFDDLFGFVNLRYLVVGVHHESEFPPTVSRLWNLQTLVIFNWSKVTAPAEIWEMPQLRHVEFHKGYLEFGYRNQSVVIMKKLQTLKGVRHMFGSVSNVIPNVKKLGVTYGYLTGLHQLTKLESYRCSGRIDGGMGTFPHSLKKLSLGSNSSHWEVNQGLLEKIGALPNLQKLRLVRAQFQRCKPGTSEGPLREWVTSEDQFPSLKFLELNSCLLECWTTDSSHFPCLEKLHLFGMKELKEIPLEIGDIPRLQSILLEYCSESVVVSAKNITEEQDELRVRVVLFDNKDNQAIRRSLASPPGFLVELVNF